VKTEELADFYRSISADEKVVDRIIATATGRTRSAPPGRSPRRVWLPIAATVAVVVALALATAGLRTTGHDQPPGTRHSSPTVRKTITHANAVLPPVQPDTISGVVLYDGQPLEGAEVVVLLQLNGTESSKLKAGDVVPARALTVPTTDVHGSYTVRFTDADLADTKNQDGPYINFEIDANSAKGSGTWNYTAVLRNRHTTGLRIVFDLGRATVTVDGKTSPLPMYQTR